MKTTAASIGTNESEGTWVQQELLGCTFKDHRLGKRFGMVLQQLSEATAESIPLACQDWANTKAAYRFFANGRVSEADILAGHFRATRERSATVGGTLLVLHDTTEFSYPRENIGLLHRPRRPERSPHPLCGISMHSSLVVTAAGLPLGLSAVKFWTRKAFKGTNALKRRVNPTRIPIEEKESVRWVDNLVETTALLGAPARCVHIGDREADIYELFCAAHDVGAHFVIRSAYPRLAEDGTTKTDTEMKEVRLGASQGRPSHRSARCRRSGFRGRARTEIPADARAPAGRKGKELRSAGTDGDPRGGARDTERPGANQLEAAHRSARALPRRRD